MGDQTKQKFSKDDLFSFLFSSSFITLFFSISFYITVASYYINFFDRLSLPFHTLNLPFSFYLYAGYYIFGIIFYAFAFIAIFIYMYISNNPDTIKTIKTEKHLLDFIEVQYIYGSLAIVALFFLIILNQPSFPLAFRNHLISIIPNYTLSFFNWLLLHNYMHIGNFILGLIFGIIFSRIIFYVRTKENALSRLLQVPGIVLMSLVATFFLLIFFIYVLPATIGYYAAQDVIDGNSDYLTMNLSLKEKNNSLNNISFTLISYCNDNYYLIERGGNSSKNVSPKLYIIPKDQVQSATVQRISNAK